MSKADPRSAGDVLAAAFARVAPAVVEIWPENWQAFQLFMRVRTQWRLSMNGPTGLAYEAVYPLIDRVVSDPDEWDELLADIQHMETAALDVIYETDG